MLLPAPPLYPRKRKLRPKAPKTPPAPAALALVAAEFWDEPGVSLTFDRAVDVAGFDGAAVRVNDPVKTGTRYDAAGATVTLTGPATVRITGLNPLGAADPGEATLLTATALSGIVAADDGGAWAGVTDLGLPFP